MHTQLYAQWVGLRRGGMVSKNEELLCAERRLLLSGEDCSKACHYAIILMLQADKDTLPNLKLISS